MLHYKRRNSIEQLTSKQSNKPIVTFLLSYGTCSYFSFYHKNLNSLKNILNSFNQDSIPFYLRVFNKTPNKVVKFFWEQYQISKTSFQFIFQSLEVDGVKVKALF